jgi:aminopeptidase N
MFMSTYLVAFSVNQFSELNGGEQDGVQYSLWARPNSYLTGAYANQMAPKAIEEMTKFTGHDYTIDKLEQMAVPDFVANAMENWGLITYRLHKDQI